MIISTTKSNIVIDGNSNLLCSELKIVCSQSNKKFKKPVVFQGILMVIRVVKVLQVASALQAEALLILLKELKQVNPGC
jgi:hypothetical protein